MPRKRKKKNTQNLNPPESRPAVPEVPAEPNPSAKSTPESSPTNPTPPTPQPQRQEPETKTNTPTLFTETQRGELYSMTESERERVIPAAMNEMFPDDENARIKQQLAEAEALYSQNQRRSPEQQARRLREAARPQRGRPLLDRPVRPRRGRPMTR